MFRKGRRRRSSGGDGGCVVEEAILRNLGGYCV